MKEWFDISVPGYDQKAASDATSYHCDPESITQQHLREDADVNVIVRRFGLTGQIPLVAAQGVFGDFTGIASYEDALAAVERADRAFMTLPPEVRERYDNDPGKLLAAAQEGSPGGLDGLVRPEPPEAAAVPPGGQIPLV